MTCTLPIAQILKWYKLHYQYQRRRRHFKSGQATANKWSLVHVKGAGGLQEAAVRTTCRIETRGCRCSPVGARRAPPDPPGKKRERFVHKGQRRACVGHLAQLSECPCSLRTGPTTRWKVVRPRPDQPDWRHRHWILKMEDHYIIWIVSVSLNSHLTNIEQKLRQSIQLSNHWNVGVLTLALYEATPPPKLKWLQSET